MPSLPGAPFLTQPPPHPFKISTPPLALALTPALSVSPSLANPVPQASLSEPSPRFTHQMPRHHFRIRDSPPFTLVAPHFSSITHAYMAPVGPSPSPLTSPSHLSAPPAGCTTLTFTLTHALNPPSLSPPVHHQTNTLPGLPACPQAPFPAQDPFPVPANPYWPPFQRLCVVLPPARAVTAAKHVACWLAGRLGAPGPISRALCLQRTLSFPSASPVLPCESPLLPCCCLLLSGPQDPSIFLLWLIKIPRFSFQCCVTRLLCMQEAGDRAVC